jgi:hypothetical protein
LRNGHNHIERTVKEICNDPDCKRTKIKSAKELAASYEFAAKEAIDCIIKAIERYVNSMSLVIQEIYRVATTQLEAKKKEFDEKQPNQVHWPLDLGYLFDKRFDFPVLKCKDVLYIIAIFIFNKQRSINKIPCTIFSSFPTVP